MISRRTSTKTSKRITMKRNIAFTCKLSPNILNNIAGSMDNRIDNHKTKGTPLHTEESSMRVRKTKSSPLQRVKGQFQSWQTKMMTSSSVLMTLPLRQKRRHNLLTSSNKMHRNSLIPLLRTLSMTVKTRQLPAETGAWFPKMHRLPSSSLNQHSLLIKEDLARSCCKLRSTRQMGKSKLSSDRAIVWKL